MKIVILFVFLSTFITVKAQETLQSVTDRGHVTTQPINAAQLRIRRLSGNYYLNVIKAVDGSNHSDILNNPIGDNVAMGNEGGGNLYLTAGGPTRVTVLQNGNVGIGTVQPALKLDVRGDMVINSGIDDNHIYWEGHNMSMGTRPGDYDHNVFQLKPGGASQGLLFSIFQMYNANSTTDRPLKVQIHSQGVSFFNGGNVGIGTDTPRERLSVNGKIRAQEIKVETANWPDYVFEPSYNPASLSELEKYVNANKHLPEIPSAKEVETNGLSLGEMNVKLLKKIEEITLLLIAKDKQLNQQEEINREQEERLKLIEHELNRVIKK